MENEVRISHQKFFIGWKIPKKIKKILKNIKKIPTGLEIAKNSEIFLMTPTKWGNTRGRRGRLI